MLILSLLPILCVCNNLNVPDSQRDATGAVWYHAFSLPFQSNKNDLSKEGLHQNVKGQPFDRYVKLIFY